MQSNRKLNKMNIENYTELAQNTIKSTIELAKQSRSPELQGIHLLKTLLDQSDGLIPQLLSQNPKSQNLKQKCQDLLAKQPKSNGSTLGASYAFEQAISKAEQMKNQMQDEFITTEHLLLGLYLDPDLKNILTSWYLEKELYGQIIALRKGKKVESQNAESHFQDLEKYTRDLTKLARENKLDPVIGRDIEIRRVLQVLQRRSKNNPVLVGHPGVGKTAIVEGIARRIASGDVPESLKKLRLLSLDLASMLAGAKYRGEFEERLKGVLKAVSESQDSTGNGVILFIDELHTLVGAGASEGAMDASNMLKPALARGELRCVGATTLDEYRKYIEKDGALERRFQPVQIDEPSQEDTISILRGLKERYEVHHGLHISDRALISAVKLSSRYLPNRQLPDKAIDLIDEAASALRLQLDSSPKDIDDLSRKITHLEIEYRSLKAEDESKSQEKAEQIEVQLLKLKAELKEKTSIWQKEKVVLQEINKLREELDKNKNRTELLQQQIPQLSTYEQRESKYRELGELNVAIQKQNQQLKDAETRLHETQQEKGGYLRQTITTEDIAQVLSRWTGIPVQKMLKEEMQKLLELEDLLRERVVGQDEAVSTVARAIRRARAGLSDPKKPLGSFLALGPTGVGKTELAKTLAQFLFDDEDALIRIDMSEYMEQHAVSRLIGAPPGYVGYEQGGQLSESVRRKPYCVVLLDEIEKAHPEVNNVLLQILDDGRLTDGQGRVVSFKNVLLIMTSNLGARDIQGLDEMTAIRKRVNEALHAHFRPELLNRIDDVIIFQPLQQEHIRGIVDIQLRHVAEKLADMGISFSVSSEAKDLLAESGYDKEFGARPLKRTIRRLVEDELAEILLGHPRDEDTKAHIYVDVINDELDIQYMEEN
jgi:ATP-dependent Clp protease ATP-binding subunit ClpB